MAETPTSSAYQLDRRARLFPVGASCVGCGERNPLALVAGRCPPRCKSCALCTRGLAPQELHHLGGRPSTQTIRIPANPHALLSLLQELRRNTFAPGSSGAYQFDLLLVRALGPSLGIQTE